MATVLLRLAATLAIAAVVAGCGVRMLRPAPATPVPPPLAKAASLQPTIQTLTAHPTTRPARGQAVNLHVVAADAAGEPLAITWTATGGTLSTTTGQLVTWHPDRPGTHTVSVLVSNGRGGATAGHLNLVVD